MNKEMRILKNFISMMPKVYRKRNANWQVVRDILLQGTNTAGSTSCRSKCIELGIYPDGTNFETTSILPLSDWEPIAEDKPKMMVCERKSNKTCNAINCKHGEPHTIEWDCISRLCVCHDNVIKCVEVVSESLR